jgi:hypothetical protein
VAELNLDKDQTAVTRHFALPRQSLSDAPVDMPWNCLINSVYWTKITHRTADFFPKI